MPVLLKLATNRVISPRLFAGHGMPCPYCRKKQRQKEVRRGNDISLLDETSMYRRGLGWECEEKWGEACDAPFATGQLNLGELR